MDNLYTSWQQELKKLEGAYAPSTIRAYYTDGRKFVDWCAAKNYAPFPITEATLVEYMEEIQEQFTRATIERRISSLRRLNRFLGFADPAGQDFFLAKRRLTAALLRPSEADPQPPETQGERTLRLHHEALRTLNGKPAREPVYVLPEPSGLEATQFILRAHRRNIKDIEWLFCATSRETCLDQPLCTRSANDIIKRAVCRVRGMRPRDRDISGHSLRVGAAQDLLIKGFDTAAIMRAGGWRSLSALSGYLDLAEHNVWK